jgi:uncharacterized protein (DUF1697 family)
MAALRSLLQGQGCTQVATYIQSGNAVFRSTVSRAKLGPRIADAIARDHCFRPALFLLSEAELAAALAANPWPEARDDAKPMHLFFHDNSAAPQARALDALLAPGEAWMMTGRVLYFRAPEGSGRSKFAAQLPRLFPATMTGRNLNTCDKLLAMLRDLG